MSAVHSARGVYTYRTNCTESTERLIRNMLDHDENREITRATFLKYVDRESLRAVEDILGYEGHPSQGLTMAGDGYVTYWKSFYRGRPCVYFSWSAIEYIFQ